MKKKFLQCLFCGTICVATTLGAIQYNTTHAVMCSVLAEEVTASPDVNYSLGTVSQPRCINLEERAVNDFVEDEETLLHEEMYYDSLELLAMLVEAEAGNQDLMGRQLVVDVVLNRVDSDKFPDDIMSVIFDDGEFSPVADGRLYTVEVSELTIEAVKLELENRTNYEVLYFRTGHFHNFGTELFKHGAHYFSK